MAVKTKEPIFISPLYFFAWSFLKYCVSFVFVLFVYKWRYYDGNINKKQFSLSIYI